MASNTIRNLDDDIKARLRIQAAYHGRSMEEEARNLLRTALCDTPNSLNLAQAIHQRFQSLQLDELELPTREPLREPPPVE